MVEFVKPWVRSQKGFWDFWPHDLVSQPQVRQDSQGTPPVSFWDKPSVQFSSFTQSYLTLCDPIDCSMLGLPVHHQLPEFTQTHVWDAIQPSHPLLSPSLPTFNISQHQGLFKWVSSLHQVAKVLEFQLQHQSFQWIFRTDFLWDEFDLLAVQGTLKSLLQCHSSKASILWPSACNPLQYSCLLNPMDWGAWWATVPGVAKSQTWLSDLTFN